MVERISGLLQRFPENEQAVKALIDVDESFDSLCQEYGKISDELRLAKKGREFDRNLDVVTLKKRLNIIEETLLSRIEGYEPV